MQRGSEQNEKGLHKTTTTTINNWNSTELKLEVLLDKNWEKLFLFFLTCFT